MDPTDSSGRGEQDATLRALQQALTNLTTSMQNRGGIGTSKADRTDSPEGVDGMTYIIFIIGIYTGSLFLLMLMYIRKSTQDNDDHPYFEEFCDREQYRRRQLIDQVQEFKERLRPPARCNSTIVGNHSPTLEHSFPYVINKVEYPKPDSSVEKNLEKDNASPTDTINDFTSSVHPDMFLLLNKLQELTSAVHSRGASMDNINDDGSMLHLHHQQQPGRTVSALFLENYVQTEQRSRAMTATGSIQNIEASVQKTLSGSIQFSL